jgi:OOP family OmpA-OmpF porin
MRGFRATQRAAASALLLALILLPSLGHAQSVTGEGPGFYAGGSIGGVFGGDDKLSGSGIDGHVDHSPGLGLLGALGMRFENGFRVEFEVGYRYEDTKKAAGIHTDGNTSLLNFGPNVLYDIRTGSRLTPYVGLGVGGADIGYHTTLPGNSIDNTGLSFAYQGIAGVAYALSDRLQVTADYRYIRALPASVPLASGGSVDANYHAHTVMVGLRWLFYPTNAAAPAPQPMPAAAPLPPPAPMPARAPPPSPTSFTVFFGFDSAEVTGQAEQVVEQAASAIKRQQVARITVTGHTDLAGSETYNQRLSLRRANAVKAALMRLGVPADSIAVVGKDGVDPALPTPVGVREPMNRRAEIVF